MDDLIDRQAAMDAMCDKCPVYDCINKCPAYYALYHLPSVNERSGHMYWVQYDANPRIGNWHCSRCRNTIPIGNHAKSFFKYCPSCGAKFDGGDA